MKKHNNFTRMSTDVVVRHTMEAFGLGAEESSWVIDFSEASVSEIDNAVSFERRQSSAAIRFCDGCNQVIRKSVKCPSCKTDSTEYCVVEVLNEKPGVPIRVNEMGLFFTRSGVAPSTNNQSSFGTLAVNDGRLKFIHQSIRIFRSALSPTRIYEGDVVKIGNACLEFSAPPQTAHGMVTNILTNETVKLSTVDIFGRSEGSVRFPDDNKMSSIHLKTTWVGDGWEVTDLDSSNGTWIALKHFEGINAGDTILVGMRTFNIVAWGGD